MAVAQPTRLPVRRHPQWQTRLAALIEQRMAAPLVWGRHDCCLFAADCVLAVTGHDPAGDLRGRYSSEEQAREQLARLGGLVELAIARAGPVVAVRHAQIGDIGIVRRGAACPDGPALAVCGGEHWLAPGRLALVAHHPRDIARAWRCTAGAAGA